MLRRPMSALALALIACHGAPSPVGPRPGPPDPDGPHRAQVGAVVKPYLDAELVSSMVVGLYDGGRMEVYGFGAGPGGKPPDGHTLFEIGSVTKVYTALLFADAIQRREVALDTPLVDLLPPGVTAPIKDKVPITLGQLALHTSGLPRLPPGLSADAANPYAAYDESALYLDLVRTELEHTPGQQVVYSNYGAGLLGFVLGKKLGGGYAKALGERVLAPLGLADTFLTVPEPLAARRAVGTNDELAPVPAWTFDALAGAGALVSSAHDQLVLIGDELDAAAGTAKKLGHAMHLTQEVQVDNGDDSESLGWLVDGHGRYWHNGGTGGFHAYVGFDPRTRHGVVVLAATSSSLFDRLADQLYTVLDGTPSPPAAFPDAAALAQLAGTYNLAGTQLHIIAVGRRLYIEGPGEPRHRLVPLSDREFLLESLQGLVVFERDAGAVGKVVRAVIVMGRQRLTAARVDDPPAP